jgi:hypothetical protein
MRKQQSTSRNLYNFLKSLYPGVMLSTKIPLVVNENVLPKNTPIMFLSFTLHKYSARHYYIKSLYKDSILKLLLIDDGKTYFEKT